MSVFGIPGVRIGERLGRGATGEVYRAERDGRAVAVKLMPLAEGASPSRMWREACSLARSRHPGLPAVLDAGVAGAHFYLVMELVQGRPLAQLVGTMDARAVRALGVELAEILGTVHDRGLVHRDVTPANVVIDERGGAHLVDFGFAGLSEGGQRVVGTPHYASPEQTGMVARPVDARSDLYSLGAVLYHVLTGRPPFDDPEPAEVVRMHASEPVPEPQVEAPADLVRTILDLLGKDPDDRPASAAIVVQRLRSDASVAPTRRALAGRTEELASLKRAWSRAALGHGAFAVVRGRSGMGKSRLAEALAEGVDGVDGSVWRFKGEPGDGRPLASVLEPLQAALDDGSAATAIAALAVEDLAVLEAYGVRLPDREPAPRHALLPPREQLLEAVKRAVFAVAATQPLLWILDDLQWLEHESVTLLDQLSDEIDAHPLLVVLTARAEEVHAAQVAERLERLQTAGSTEAVRVDLALEPLSPRETAELLAQELSLPASRVDPALVEQVEAHASGRPLSVLAYLQALFEGGALVPRDGRWVLEPDALRSLDLPDDVASLVLRRLQDLPDTTLDVLRTAALLTLPVSVDLLVATGVATQEECVGALGHALDRQLLEASTAGRYVFAHDRLREALLEGVSSDATTRWHRAIADALRHSARTDDDTVLALAHHAWLGLTDGGVFEALVAGGTVSMRRSAYSHAHLLFSRALELAEPGDPELPSVATGLARQMGQVCARLGKMDDANTWLTRALEVSTDPVERAGIQLELGRVALGRLDSDQARAAFGLGIAELGETPLQGGLGSLLAVLWALVLWVASRYVPSVVTRVAPEAEPREAVLVNLISHYAEAAYFDIDTTTVLKAVIRAAPVSLRIRGTPADAGWAARASLILALLKRRGPALSHLEHAREVAEASGEPAVMAIALTYHAHSLHFLGDVLESEHAGHACLERWGPWMDNSDYLTLVAGHCWSLLMRGFAEDAAPWLDAGLRRVRLARSVVAEGHTFRCYAGPVHAYLGRPEEGRAHLDAFAAVIERSPPNRWRSGQYLAHKALYLVLRDDLGPELEQTFTAFDALGLKIERTPLQFKQVWVALAYARLHQVERGERPQADLDAALEKLKAAVSHPTLEAHLQVVRAGSHAIRGEADEAERCLEAAARIARQTDNAWVEREIAQRRASMLEAAGRPRAAARALSGAGLRGRTRTASTSILTQWDGDSQLRRHLEGLQEVGRASASILDLEEKARVALAEVRRLVGAERALMFLDDPEGPERTADVGENSTLGADDPVSTTVIQRARETGETVVITGTSDGETLSTSSVRAADLRSIAAAPMRLGDRVVGVLYVDSSLAKGIFSERTAVLLDTIASQLAMAFETARLAGIELLAQTERARRMLSEQVRAISEGFGSSLDLTDVVRALADGLGEQFPGVSITLVVPAPEGVQQVTVGDAPPSSDPDALIGQLRGRPSAVALPDGRIGVPLRVRDEERAYLVLTCATDPAPVIEALDTFSGQVATAVENARLYQEVQAANQSLERRVAERTAELEQEVAERRAAERSALVATRAKSAFLANMSHELRTPLNAVSGYTEIVRDELEDADQPDLAADLDKVLTAVGDLTTIIDDILNLTRIEADRFDLALEQVDVRPVVLEALASLEHTAKADIRIHVHGDSRVTCDAFRLRQALEKVLLNALQFADTGVDVRLAAHDGRTRIEIQDDGPGIPDDQRERIFERFVQANDSSTRTHGGVGLGLAIARNLMERMDGSLTFRPAEPRGSVFVAELPTVTAPV